MILSEWLVIGTIVLLLMTALMHSIMGERMLIGPLLEQGGNRVLEHNLSRMLIRFGWHVTSLMWVLLAISLYGVMFKHMSAATLLLASTGICFLCIGIFDLIFSKGRHIGWLPLTLIGAFSLLAIYF